MHAYESRCLIVHVLAGLTYQWHPYRSLFNKCDAISTISGCRWVTQVLIRFSEPQKSLTPLRLPNMASCRSHTQPNPHTSQLLSAPRGSALRNLRSRFYKVVGRRNRRSCSTAGLPYVIARRVSGDNSPSLHSWQGQ